jgi:hypothetical protein
MSREWANESGTFLRAHPITHRETTYAACMPAPKKAKATFRLALDAAWDHALEAQNRLDDTSTPADVAAVAQAWAAVATATSVILSSFGRWRGRAWPGSASQASPVTPFMVRGRPSCSRRHVEFARAA